MPVTHQKVSGVADSADPTIIRPSDWNALHLSAPDTAVLSPLGLRTETNATANLAFGAIHGVVFDTRNAIQFRFGVNMVVPGSINFAWFLAYFGADQVQHLLNGAGQTLAANTAGLKVSPWLVLPSDARAELMRFSLRFQGGDGVADPSFGTCFFSIR
jgi:hypothetical protein